MSRGFSVVEIVLVVGIASLVLVGILQLAVLAARPITVGIRDAEATALAEEGIEAVRAIRNESWGTNIAPLANDTTYYPIIASARWRLATTDPGPVQGTYSRLVTFGAVYRNANDDISDTGTLDSNTRKVTATVTWNDHNQEKNVVIETYITNFLST